MKVWIICQELQLEFEYEIHGLQITFEEIKEYLTNEYDAEISEYKLNYLGQVRDFSERFRSEPINLDPVSDTPIVLTKGHVPA